MAEDKENINISTYLNPLNLLPKKSTGSNGKGHANTKRQTHAGITWIDVENPSQHELEKLTEDFHFHHLHIEENLFKEQLPQFEKEEDYLFLLFNIPDQSQGSNKITTSHLGIFLGKDYLVTIHEETVPGIRELFHSCEQDADIRESYFKKSSGFLLFNIISGYINDLYNLLTPIQEELDKIEDNVFDGEKSDALPISQLRHKIIRMRRVTGGLMVVLEELVPHINSFADENLSRYFVRNVKSVNKLQEMIEDASEIIEVYKDADFTASTGKTNEILAVLTLIFTFTIPPTVIGTFYGMNINLPGGIQTGAWTYLGQYTTLIVICIVSGIPVLLMYWYFKKKKWL